MKKPILFRIVLGLSLTALGLILTYRNSASSPLISPLSTVPIVLGTTTNTSPKDRAVIAFLPYWLITEVKDRPLPPITHLAYFGLEFDGQGNLRKLDSDGNQEPGFTHYLREPFSQITRKVKDKGGKVLLVLRMMKNSDIETALRTPQTRAKIITESVTTVTQRSFDGINIDFEYVGAPPASLVKNLTEFTTELKKACPNCHLSIDVYADASKKARIWDIKALAQIVDYIIIMGYDFHTRASTVTGSVAPLRGACPNSLLERVLDKTPCYYDYDITTSVRDFLSLVPSYKLVLAVPFYGYEWATSATSPYTDTLEKGITAPYKKVQALTASLKLVKEPHQLTFDSISLTPYLIYKDEGQTKQIWFDDLISLGLKRELVDSADLAGIAVWAWGYEDEANSLWEAVSTPRP